VIVEKWERWGWSEVWSVECGVRVGGVEWSVGLEEDWPCDCDCDSDWHCH
jgi:hypothetical protein